MTDQRDPASEPPPGYGPPPGWDPGTGSTPPPAAGWGAPAGQPAWGPPQGQGPSGQWQGGQQTETKAVVALVLAIAAYTFVPFLAAVAALVLANMAKRDIAASGGRLTGQGLATAAFWLSVVHLSFVALLFMGLALFYVVLGGFGFS